MDIDGARIPAGVGAADEVGGFKDSGDGGGGGVGGEVGEGEVEAGVCWGGGGEVEGCWGVEEGGDSGGEVGVEEGSEGGSGGGGGCGEGEAEEEEEGGETHFGVGVCFV